MLVADFVTMELKRIEHLKEFDLQSTSWYILITLNHKYGIKYNDRTLEMKEEEVEQVRREIYRQLLKFRRS